MKKMIGELQNGSLELQTGIFLNDCQFIYKKTYCPAGYCISTPVLCMSGLYMTFKDGKLADNSSFI